MKNRVRDCIRFRERKREIKGRENRLRKRASTVINECDTRMCVCVCVRERERDMSED